MVKHLAAFVAALTILSISASSYAQQLVADYKFNNPTNVGQDSSGNNFNATNNHGAIQGFASNGGGYIAVSGGTYLITPALSGVGTGPLGTTDTSVSISTWFNASPSGTGGVVVTELGSTTTNNGWHDTEIEVDSGSASNGVWPYTNGNNHPELSGGHIAPGAWYQDTLVYNNTAQTVSEYIDGALVATAPQNRQSPWANGGLQYYAFGPADDTNFGNGVAFNGLIGETEIFNGALSSAQVGALFAAQVGEYVPEPSSVIALLGLCGMGAVCLLFHGKSSLPSHLFAWIGRQPMAKHLTAFVAALAILGISTSSHAATLVADYQFNSAGSVDTDSSVNGFNGSTSGIVTQGNTTYGGHGGYIAVSGGSYFVTPALSGNSGTGPLGTTDTSVSISTWFNATPGGPNGPIVNEQGTSTPNANWYDSQIELEANGTLKNSVWDRKAIISGGPLAQGLWYQATLVYDNSLETLSEYIDGKLVSSASFAGRLPPWQHGNFQYYALGAQDDTNFGNNSAFSGLIGETEIFNGALSAAQVAAMFAAEQGAYILPEPSSIIALVGLCGMGAIILVHRQRRGA
jgi:hypothetical protein